jgi:hypothetical protein
MLMWCGYTPQTVSTQHCDDSFVVTAHACAPAAVDQARGRGRKRGVFRRQRDGHAVRLRPLLVIHVWRLPCDSRQGRALLQPPLPPHQQRLHVVHAAHALGKHACMRCFGMLCH